MKVTFIPVGGDILDINTMNGITVGGVLEQCGHGDDGGIVKVRRGDVVREADRSERLEDGDVVVLSKVVEGGCRG